MGRGFPVSQATASYRCGWRPLIQEGQERPFHNKQTQTSLQLLSGEDRGTSAGRCSFIFVPWVFFFLLREPVSGKRDGTMWTCLPQKRSRLSHWGDKKARAPSHRLPKEWFWEACVQEMKSFPPKHWLPFEEGSTSTALWEIPGQGTLKKKKKDGTKGEFWQFCFIH